MKPIPHAIAGIVTCISLLLYACSKDQAVTDPPEKTQTSEYWIKAGNHYCEQEQMEFMTDPAIQAMVTFDSSAVYTSQVANNQGDVNKLIGFSDCGANHQENSARLGWSWNGRKFVVYAYAYVNKTRIIKTLDSVDVKQSFPCSVKGRGYYNYFKVNDHTDSVERACAGYTGYHYKLFPYFGGDEAAPHDMRIVVVEQ